MSAILAATRVIRRLLLTPSRAGISLLLGGMLTIAATVANLRTTEAGIVADLVPNGLLLVVVPLVSLVFAVGALGDLVDDGTLVYVWLKPLPRWQLAIAAMLATWEYVVPIAGITAAAVAIGGGQSNLLPAAVLSCVLASMAYSALFVALGLRTTKSLLGGLAFVLIWEGFLAGISAGIATWSVRRWSSSVFATVGGRAASSPLDEAGTVHAVAVLVGIAVVGLGLTARWLTTRDIP